MDVRRNPQPSAHALNKAILDLAGVWGRPPGGARKIACNYSVVKQEKQK